MSLFMLLPILVFLGLLVAGVVVVLIKMVTGNEGSTPGHTDSGDIETLLEIQRGLELMEKRIEALEILLLDRDYTFKRR